jgi:hypothetical protein
MSQALPALLPSDPLSFPQQVFLLLKHFQESAAVSPQERRRRHRSLAPTTSPAVLRLRQQMSQALPALLTSYPLSVPQQISLPLYVEELPSPKQRYFQLLPWQV